MNADADFELNEMFSRHRERLRLMVDLRMDRRLASRVDASDVIQEAFVEAAARFHEFASEEQEVSTYVWLRFIVGQKLLQFHRRHLNVQARSVLRESRQPIESGVSSAVMAERFVDGGTSPSFAAEREEAIRQLQSMVESLSENDSEILALRHFEQVTNAEAAQVLGISEDTSYRRYVRALKRLRQCLQAAEDNESKN